MDVNGDADGRKFVVENLPADQLDIDPGVQRPPNPTRIARIADTFQESALGVFTISRRKGGRNVVLDGQTRLLALRRFTGAADTVYPVTCQVYLNLTREEEADIFLRHNDRAAVKSIDRFRVALVAGEDWASDINALVIKHGFVVDTGAQPERRFVAISTVDRIRRTEGGMDALDRAFDTVVRAWGHTVNAASADSIGGIATAFLRHGKDLESPRLPDVLARSGNPKAFIGNVAQLRAALSISRAEAAYRHVLAVYNKGLRHRRLEPRK